MSEMIHADTNIHIWRKWSKEKCTIEQVVDLSKIHRRCGTPSATNGALVQKLLLRSSHINFVCFKSHTH